MVELNASQVAAVNAGGRGFLRGEAGTGKSTALLHRFWRLIQEGSLPYSILVIVADSALAKVFSRDLHKLEPGPVSELSVFTFTGIARKMISIFWPLIARQSGFSAPHNPPVFLTYDLAQILMARIVAPYIDGGAFSGLAIRRQQIVSQILDTLNRASLNGISLDEALERQISTWAGLDGGRMALEDAALAAREFRQVCVDRNLLDLSLLVEVFQTRLIHDDRFEDYFRERYRHLLVDNLEEQAPAGLAFITHLMASMESVALAFDEGGGYKRFLAADPEGARTLQEKCSALIDFDENFVSSIELTHLANLVENKLQFSRFPIEKASLAVRGSIDVRFRRQMIAAAVELIKQHVDSGVETGEIALIAPYLDGGLRLTLANELNRAGLAYRFLRRRTLPRDDPWVRAWLTWLKISHRAWGYRPSSYDVAEAARLSFKSLDPIRAHLLARHLYDPAVPAVQPASSCPQPIAERLGDHHLASWELLRLWLEDHGDGRLDIDAFLYRLFHELLGRSRFSAEPNFQAAAACDLLVRTVHRIEQSSVQLGLGTPADISLALIDGIEQGLVSSQRPEIQLSSEPEGILIATVYSFLLQGRPALLQVWLDAAATGWWDIPRQPLSNAFVLNPRWPADRLWTMEDDIALRNQLLTRLIRGLTNRCAGGVILANSEIDRRGYRQDGPLWRALYPVRDLYANRTTV